MFKTPKKFEDSVNNKLCFTVYCCDYNSNLNKKSDIWQFSASAFYNV